MKAIEVTEKATKALEDEGSLGTSISSGFRSTCGIIRENAAYQAACSAYREYPAMIPVLLDRVAQYIRITPGQYEHPMDVTLLAFLLLTEDVYGAQSSELKVLMAAADLLANPWWTRQFVERMRAPSQSGP